MVIIYLLLSYFTTRLIVRKHLKLLGNQVLILCFETFIATFVPVVLIFLLACGLSYVTDALLLKATYAVMYAQAGIVVLYRNRVIAELTDIVTSMKIGWLLTVAFVLVFIGLYWLFGRLLTQHDSQLFVSKAYWDYRWHIFLIQSFVIGDNFPPQNPAFAGVYHIYHYFFALIPAIYRVLGASVAQAINLYSALYLSLVILTGWGLARSYSKSSIILLFLPIFILTHGSLKVFEFISDALHYSDASIRLFQNNVPYLVDVNQAAFGYNGNMWNIFYYIQERQLIIGVFCYLIFVSTILLYKRLPKLLLVFLGCCFGLLLQWHVYVMLMLAVISVTMLMLTGLAEKKMPYHMLAFVLPLLSVFLLNYGLLHWYLSHDPHFDQALFAKYPRFNPNFSTLPHTYPLSVWHFLGYYAYAYGFRLMIYTVGLYYIFKHDKNLRLFMLSLIPIFILINTLEISPLNVYDNHKWLKPFNLTLDIFTLTFFVKYFPPTLFRRAMICAGIILASLTGLIVIFHYTLQKPHVLVTDFRLPVYKAVANLPTDSVVLTDSPNYLLLAGHKIYASQEITSEDIGLNDKPRKKLLQQVTANQSQACRIIRSYDKDRLITTVALFNQRYFIDVATTCKLIKS